MNPKIAQRGTSFKGASLYYLHDKRGNDKDSHRTSSERVAWTKTRNITSDNAEFAFRIMSATAMDKDRLKAQAGVKNTGNKSKGDVYSYSLAWHPEEKGKFSQADMLEAVDQSLKALGAQDHQAVIIAHQDTAHPHVHVVLNMVHPQNGKNLNLSNDRNKLDKWANIYRKSRGEEYKYNPNRDRKYNAIDDRKRGMKVPFIDGENIPRSLKEDFKQVKNLGDKNDYQRFKQQVKEQYQGEKIRVSVNGKTEDLNLSQFGLYQKTKHCQEWHVLKTEYAQKKKQISKDYFNEKERTIEAIKSQMKPAFAEAYKQHRQQVAYWNKRDKHLVGKLQNALEAVKFTKKQGRGENKHFVHSLFTALSKTGYREQALKNVLYKQLKTIKAEQNKQIKHAVSMLNNDRKGRLSGAKQGLDLKAQLLKDTQKNERLELQSRWQRLNDRRKKAIKAFSLKGRVSPAEKARMTPEDEITARQEFQKKVRARKRGGRSRTRKRTRDD